MVRDSVSILEILVQFLFIYWIVLLIISLYVNAMCIVILIGSVDIVLGEADK